MLSLLPFVKRQPLHPRLLLEGMWPANLQESDRVYFSHARLTDLVPSWLLRFREVSLYWDGAAFHGLRIYKETFAIPEQPIHNWRGLLHMHLRLPRQRLPAGQLYVVAHDAFSESYHHWLADALPRLMAVREQFPNAVLLLPITYSQEYHQETLKALGVTTIVHLKPDVRYVVPDLLLPTRLAYVSGYVPAAMQKLRTLLLANIKQAPAPNLGERIYVSRAKASRRQVLNEAEVADYVHSKGFAIVQLEDYTFTEQVSLMARARILISIHGAGLTNMLFMQPGGRILELTIKDNGLNQFYYRLTNALQHEYYYQFCEPEDAALSVQENNLRVIMPEFEQIVEQMLTV